MNTPSSLLPEWKNHSGISPRTALLVLALLTWCAHEPSQQKELHPTLTTENEKKTLTYLQYQAQEVVEMLTKEMEHNNHLQSLEYIKKYITDELKKRGFVMIMVSWQILPPIKNDKGDWDYLKLSIFWMSEKVDITLGANNETITAQILSNMAESMKRDITEKVSSVFQEIVKENNGTFEKSLLQTKIDETLKKHSHMCMQNGFQYRGIEIGKNLETGSTEIHVNLFDVSNQKDVTIPIPVNITPREKKEPERRDRERRVPKTMLA